MVPVRPFATLMLAAFALVASAAEPYLELERRLTPEQLQETGLDRLTPQQLARLNQLLREKQESLPARPPARTANTDAAPPRDEPHAAPMDLEIRTIRSRLRGTVSGWAPGSEFRLENGQTWKVLKGELTLRKPLETPEVLVVPGVAGRWFLQVHEDYPKARVYRTD